MIRRYACQKTLTGWRIWDWARSLSMGEYAHGYPAHRGACQRYAARLNGEDGR